MGAKDIITKDYTKECDVFADAFNQYIYKGKQVIKPENLKRARKAAAVISTVTGVEIEEDVEEEKVDMCQALREMLEDSVQDERVAVAKRMLGEGCFSVELIARMANLSVEEVQALQI